MKTIKMLGKTTQTDKHRGQLSINSSYQSCLFDPASTIYPFPDLNVWMKMTEQLKTSRPAAEKHPLRAITSV